MKRKYIKHLSSLFISLFALGSFAITALAIGPFDSIHSVYSDSGFSYEAYNRISVDTDGSFDSITSVRCTNNTADSGRMGVQTVVYTEAGARYCESIFLYNQASISQNVYLSISYPDLNPPAGNYKAQGLTRARSSNPGIFAPFNQYGTFATGYYTVL